jgi:cytosine/adenosine deaminase-related metal-dependent hydrolase
MKSSIIIKNGTIVTVNPKMDIINGDIYIEDGVILEVPSPRQNADLIIDALDKLVLPGFVQVHVHLNQTLFRGLADDMDVVDWLKKRIWPLEQAHNYDSVYCSARLSILEMLRSGTTTAVTMESLNHTEAAFQAVEEMGFRAVIGNAMMDRWEAGTEMKGESTDVALAKSMALFERYHGKGNGRLHFAFCPRGTRNATDELWQEIREIARDNKIIIHSHAAENKLQTERLSDYGGSEVVYLNNMGVLGPNLILAHAIWLTDEEYDLLASTGTNVAHCPSANFKLASGIAPVPAMLLKGINVAVGADGAPCNNNLDAFHEMRLAALIHKPRFGPTSMPAEKVLKMMTIGGAKAAGLDHEIGSIEEGKKADLIIINQKVPHAYPSFGSDPISRIVYDHQSRDVDTVIIDGKVIIQEGHFMESDEMEILSRSEVARMELLNRLLDPVKSEIIG